MPPLQTDRKLSRVAIVEANLKAVLIISGAFAHYGNERVLSCEFNGAHGSELSINNYMERKEFRNTEKLIPD
jgi:hypothetical protein